MSKKKAVKKNKPVDPTPELLARARKLLAEIRDRGLQRQFPYSYLANEEKDGKVIANMVNVIRVAELYGHVQTAAKLGYDTQLQALNGTLQVVFVKRMPYIPSDLL